MSGSKQYTNELENWFASFPGPLQDVLRPAFNGMTEGLQWVAGDPQELIAAGETYVQIGGRLHDLVAQQSSDRAQLVGLWTGESYDAFAAKMAEIESQLTELAKATEMTRELLEGAAQAAVEGANAIIELIIAAFVFILADWAVCAALSVITAGASLLAGAAAAVAEAAMTLARILRVVKTVATALERVAALFLRLDMIFVKIAKYLQKLLELMQKLTAAKGLWGKEKLAATAQFAGIAYGTSQSVHYGTGGYVTIPGKVGQSYETGSGFADAWSTADDVANPKAVDTDDYDPAKYR